MEFKAIKHLNFWKKTLIMMLIDVCISAVGYIIGGSQGFFITLAILWVLGFALYLKAILALIIVFFWAEKDQVIENFYQVFKKNKFPCMDDDPDCNVYLNNVIDNSNSRKLVTCAAIISGIIMTRKEMNPVISSLTYIPAFEMGLKKYLDECDCSEDKTQDNLPDYLDSDGRNFVYKLAVEYEKASAYFCISSEGYCEINKEYSDKCRKISDDAFEIACALHTKDQAKRNKALFEANMLEVMKEDSSKLFGKEQQQLLYDYYTTLIYAANRGSL